FAPSMGPGRQVMRCAERSISAAVAAAAVASLAYATASRQPPPTLPGSGSRAAVRSRPVYAGDARVDGKVTLPQASLWVNYILEESGKQLGIVVVAQPGSREKRVRLVPRDPTCREVVGAL